jgi:hypothetical protein
MYVFGDTCIRGHFAMFVSKLPPKPDFDMLAAAAPASADRRMFIFDSSGAITHTQSMRLMETRS